MRQMSGCVSLDILLGGGSRSTHHPRPRGLPPNRGFHYDHLFLRLAMMAQVVFTRADSLATLLKDRWEFVGRVEVISSAHTTTSFIGLTPRTSWALFIAAQRPYGFWACLRKGERAWSRGTHIFNVKSPPLCSKPICCLSPAYWM